MNKKGNKKQPIPVKKVAVNNNEAAAQGIIQTVPTIQPDTLGFYVNPWKTATANTIVFNTAHQAILDTFLNELEKTEPIDEHDTMNPAFTNTPIKDLYDFNNLQVEQNKHSRYEKTLAPSVYPMVLDNIRVGLEIEVENMCNHVISEYYWHVKKDGSLRNNGLEFVSIPLMSKQVEPALNYINKQMSMENNPDFSPRTSVHVHLNVRDLTWDQIKTLVALYCIFERHFFTLAGTKREESIFCVPLYKTNFARDLDNLEHAHKDLHKYAALNLLPILGGKDIGRYGTIEFRHLYGTSNPEIIIPWINNILCLRKAINNYTYEQIKTLIKELNTTSGYFALYQQIFGPYANLDALKKIDFEYPISQTKYGLFGKDYHKTYNFSADSVAYKFLLEH